MVRRCAARTRTATVSDRGPLPVTLHLPLRLGPKQKRALYASIAALWLFGALWLLFHYFLQQPGTFGPRPHPLEPWWLRLHGLASMLTLLALGTLFVAHIPRSWTLKRNRAMGVSLAVVFIDLIATGYALYYFPGDGERPWLPWLHWVPGLALPVVLWLHVRTGRARRAELRPAGRRAS